MELFKQPQYSPLAVEQQVVVLWTMQNGYMDDVPVDRIKDFQGKLLEFIGTRKDAVLASIRDKKALDKENEPQVKAAVEEFKGTFR